MTGSAAMDSQKPIDFFSEAIQDPEVRRYFERECTVDEFLLQIEDLEVEVDGG